MTLKNHSKILAIVGASGHGRVAAGIALETGWDDVVFFDDRSAEKGKFEHWQYAGNTEALLDYHNTFSGVFIAIGNNEVRYEKLQLFLDNGANVVNLIHPKTIISPFSKIGIGVIVIGGAVINPFCEIGDGVIVNANATIGHDCTVGKCVHIAPGSNIAGDVHIGNKSWVGIGASIIQGLTIGNNVMIGSSAAVIRNVDDGQTLVGVPAKPISKAPKR